MKKTHILFDLDELLKVFNQENFFYFSFTSPKDQKTFFPSQIYDPSNFEVNYKLLSFFKNNSRFSDWIVPLYCGYLKQVQLKLHQDNRKVEYSILMRFGFQISTIIEVISFIQHASDFSFHNFFIKLDYDHVFQSYLEKNVINQRTIMIGTTDDKSENNQKKGEF